MKVHDLVSIVIPTYNRAELLLQAVESAFMQTYKNIEVVVSDDGSTDDTEKLIKSRFPGVVYIKHRHGGVSYSRNVAIRSAKGRYIAFLDDDDYWDERFIERCLDRINGTDFAGVVTNYYKLYPSGDRVIGYKKGKVPEVIDIGWIVRGSFIDPSTVVVKRDVLVKAGMFDESLEVTEDWDLWLRILRKERFIYLDEPLVYKRVRVDGSLPVKTWRHNCIVMEKFYASLSREEREKLKSVLDKTRMRVFLRYATAMLHEGNSKRAREYFRKALSVKPFYPKALFRYALTFIPKTVAKALDGVYFRKLKSLKKAAKYG